ncbi:OsmY domain-containing protein [Rhodoferax lacus]|uniref:OsmY domain-containing protein n=1 Tax=Rhodoferax lacus TaxID=2184758 RepID=A0A3E1R9N2_9BURK|nr:BON domain-containing protein [Rhodoferax lacus]RFO96047.1 OsmY domain-containing protein [Rhodoferax lacus]
MKTDAQIKSDVLDELEWDPAVNAADIGVIVKDRVVTLTGHLKSLPEKSAAERAAQRVSGVMAIVVEMDVQLGPDAVRGDTDIAAAVNHVLAWTTAVPNGAIHVKVEKGWVSLDGSVDWGYQRQAAEKAVQALVGVVGISNRITVKPRLSSTDIQRGIERALTRHAEREAKHLQVQVEGSRVTLRGPVGSWAERQAAQGAAWSAPGVTAVSNELYLR